MLKPSLFFLILFSILTANAASEITIAPDFTVSGASFVETGVSGTPAVTTVQTVYGGTVGTGCDDGGAFTATCDSCIKNPNFISCNQASIYPSLKMTITVKMSKDITATTATANGAIVSLGPTGNGAPVSLATFTVSNPIVGAIQSATITWSQLFSDFTTSGTTTMYVGVGVDTNNDGSYTEELRTFPVKLHVVDSGSGDATQSFCMTTANSGVCNVVLKPGDKKAVITSVPVGVGSDTVSGIPWDGIAFFPIKVANDGTGDAAAFTGFSRVNITPIVKGMTATGGISENNLTGEGIENYQRYCFVFGTRNKAQNIYRIVTDANAAPNVCLMPSEVVGILDDKHCFIATAAFGSDMAPQVQTFREFRNKFLLTNAIGKQFIKAYYQYGPIAADFISQSETLRTFARGFLYPILGLVYVSLQYGLLASLLTLAVFLILLSQVRFFLFGGRGKKVSLILLILLFTPFLKADMKAQTKKVQHPGAAEGLIRVKKDGTYIYDTKKPLKNQSSHIRVGQGQSPTMTIEIEQKNSAGVSTGTKSYNFKDFYPESSTLVLGYDYEWFRYVTPQGKFGLQGGASITLNQGHGRLVASSAGGSDVAEEALTFFTVPFLAGAVYRMEWKDRQLFAPYIAGGGTYLLLAEKREDKSKPNFAGGFGYYAAGGVLTNLSYFDSELGFALDSEYDIGNLWLSIEFRMVEVEGASFAFSNQYLNAGLSFDF